MPSKAFFATGLGILAAACTGAAGVLAEPYHTYLIQAAAILTAIGVALAARTSGAGPAR